MNKRFNIIAVMILLALIMIIFSPLIRGYYIQDGDLNDSYIPIKQSIRNHMLNGEIPLTEKSSGLGFPIYRDPHNGIWNIFNLILFMPSDIFISVYLMIMAAMLIMGMGSYWLMYMLTQSRLKSLFIGIVMTAGSFTVSRIGHYSILVSLSIIPLYFLFLMQMLKSAKRRYSVGTAVTLFIMLAGGHPQIFLSVMIITAITLGRDIIKNMNAVFTYFMGFLMTAIIWLPLLNQAGKTQRLVGGISITMTVKSMLQSVYPALHYSFKSVIPSVYSGPFNIYEISSYFGICAVIFIAAVIADLIKRRRKSLHLSDYMPFIAALVLILMSFVKITGFGVFNTPVRYFGIGYMLAVFWAVKLIEKGMLKRKTILTLAVCFVCISAVLLIMKFPALPVLEIMILFLIFSTIMIFAGESLMWKILIAVTAVELLFFSLPLYNWQPRESVVNRPFDMLKNRSVITFLPAQYEIYTDSILAMYPDENTESLKRMSAFGERGIYYDAYSYNLYSTTAFRNYVSMFRDSMILNGGFSDLQYIINPSPMYYDYVFIPDMPVIFSIDSMFTLKNGYSSIYVSQGVDVGNAYTGRMDTSITFFNVVKYDICENDSVVLKGTGTVYMLNDNKGNTVHYSRFLQDYGFRVIKSGPYTLMESPFYGNKEHYVVDPDNGMIVREDELHFVPYDLIVAGPVSIVGLILLCLVPYPIRKTRKQYCEKHDK